MSDGINPNSGELSADAQVLLKGSRVVSLAMISGVLVFAGVLLVVQQRKLSDQLGVISTMGLVSTAVLLIVSWVVPPLIAPKFSSESSAQTWFLEMLLTMVFLEAAALSNLLGVMMEQCQYSVAAVVVAVVIMVLRFPTASRLRTWLQLRQQNSGVGAVS